MRSKVKTWIQDWQAHPTKALLHVYLVSIVVVLLGNLLAGLFHLVAYQTGYYQTKKLSLDDFQSVGVQRLDANAVLTETDDAQLLYSGNVRSIKIKCDFLQNPGEFVSFYTDSPEHSFGVDRMKYAKIKNGYYVFEYPVGTKQVRVDLGVLPSVEVQFSEIILNPKELPQMFAYSNAELFYLFTVPLLIFLLLDTGMKGWLAIKAGRKKKA